MGYEADIEVWIDGVSARGKAMLEEREILFRPEGKRGATVRVVLDGATELSADDGTLIVKNTESELRFVLGRAAAKWLAKAKAPPSRLAKLGLRDGVRFVVRNVDDPAFDAELAAAGLVPSSRLSKAIDVVLYCARSQADLDVIESFIEKTSSAVAIWVVWPKGKKELTETHVRARAHEAGLVDVKVVRFSDLLSALKLVVRKSERR